MKMGVYTFISWVVKKPHLLPLVHDKRCLSQIAKNQCWGHYYKRKFAFISVRPVFTNGHKGFIAVCTGWKAGELCVSRVDFLCRVCLFHRTIRLDGPSKGLNRILCQDAGFVGTKPSKKYGHPASFENLQWRRFYNLPRQFVLLSYCSST